MTALAYAAAAIFAFLGATHLLYTLHDCIRRPRYFRPTGGSLLDAMRLTRTAIAPTGRDYWTGILGFHLSHSIGVLLFGLLITIATAHTIVWLKPALVFIGATYAVISYRCWFSLPTVGILVATVLMTIGWLA